MRDPKSAYPRRPSVAEHDDGLFSIRHKPPTFLLDLLSTEMYYTEDDKMTPAEPRKITLKGTPREIGFRHGELLASEIQRQIDMYRDMFKVTSHLSWDSVIEIAAEYASTIKRLIPAIFEEMQGIADGAKVQLHDIVALNCRSEIALGHFSDGCTSLAWNTGRQSGGSKEDMFLGQNWDWTERAKQNLVMMSIEQEGKPKIYMITESGIVGKIGFNSSAVGTCLNAIRARPTISSQIPIHVALRLCLESTSVDEAIKTLEATGNVASSQHILIADSTKAVGMELSPLGNVYLAESNGIITHTNHFIRNKYVEEPMWLAGSPVRLKRAGELVNELMEDGITDSEICETLLRDKIFSDTYNTPEAICCSENPTHPIETRCQTLFNIVMHLNRSNPSAEIVWGKPGSHDRGPVLAMPWQ